MSYIVPNSTIYILEDIRFDKSYNDTICYSTDPTNLPQARAYQFNYYFSQFIKYTLQKQYYTRKERGWVRVNLPYESVYNCNYMIFKNTSYEDRYFYAFIDEIRYINNAVSEIHFTLDVIQTWFFDIQWNSVYIDRAHSLTDNAGDNIVPEDFPVNEVDFEEYPVPTAFERIGCVVGSTVEMYSINPLNPTYDNVGGELRQRIYGGVKYYYWDDYNNTVFNYTFLNSVLKDMTLKGKSPAIVNMFMFPYALFNQTPASLTNYEDNEPTDPTFIRLTNPVNDYATLGPYTPRNKKLLTAPFNGIYVTDGNGQSAVYRGEFFRDANDEILHTVKFKLQASVTSAPELQIVPLHYDALDANFMQKLTTQYFATCPYAIDSYLAWLAQTRVPRWLGIADSIISFAKPAVNALDATFNMEDLSYDLDTEENINAWKAESERAEKSKKQATNAVTNLATNLATTLLNSYRPPVAQGQQQNAMSTSIDRVGFRLYHFYIKPYWARRIDDFMSRYGYAIKDFGDVWEYINARRYFSYVKTVNCNATGNIPNDDIVLINDIMNKGITFWNATCGNTIKDYDQYIPINIPINI